MKNQKETKSRLLSIEELDKLTKNNPMLKEWVDAKVEAAKGSVNPDPDFDPGFRLVPKRGR